MGYLCVSPPVLLLISPGRGVWESNISFIGVWLSDSGWGVDGDVLGDGEGDASETGLEITRGELSGEVLGFSPFGLMVKFNGEEAGRAELSEEAPLSDGAGVSDDWVIEPVPVSVPGVASCAKVVSGSEDATVEIKQITAAICLNGFMVIV